jgi:hypothetical protein
MNARNPSRIAVVMTDSPDDPDALVPVPAGELFEWAWLAAELADWLDHAVEATRTDFAHHFTELRSPHRTAVFLAQISQRIGSLLDTDRGQQ